MKGKKPDVVVEMDLALQPVSMREATRELVALRDVPGPAINPVNLYVSSLASPASKETIVKSLLHAVRIFRSDPTLDRTAILTFPWCALRVHHMEALKAELTGRYSFRTGNLVITSVRGAIKACRRLGLIDENQHREAVAVKPIRGNRAKAGRAISVEELRGLVEACGQHRNINIRDAALIMLLYETGMRKSEAVKITLEDYDVEEGSIRVIGKGNKEREIAVNQELAEELKRWLDVRGREPGTIFLCMNRWGHVLPRGMSKDALSFVLEKVFQVANQSLETEMKPITPHDFRRTFITTLIEDNVPLTTVAAAVGHANVNTTAAYVRSGFKKVKEAVARMPRLRG